MTPGGVQSIIVGDGVRLTIQVPVNARPGEKFSFRMPQPAQAAQLQPARPQPPQSQPPQLQPVQPQPAQLQPAQPQPPQSQHPQLQPVQPQPAQPQPAQPQPVQPQPVQPQPEDSQNVPEEGQEDDFVDAPTSRELEELLQLEEDHGTPDDAAVDEEAQEASELSVVQLELAALASLVDTLTPAKHTCGCCLQPVFEPEMRVAVSGPFRNNWVCLDETECNVRLQAASGTRRKRKAATQRDS